MPRARRVGPALARTLAAAAIALAMQGRDHGAEARLEQRVYHEPAERTPEHWETLPAPGGSSCDLIQRHAARQGVYSPTDDPADRYHIFSQAEAAACLVGLGKRLVFAGDSFQMQHLIGLGDILLAKEAQFESKNWRAMNMQRGVAYLDHRITQRREAWVDLAKKGIAAKYNGTIRVGYYCSKKGECYGGGSDGMKSCARCLRGGLKPDDILVMSAGVHMAKRYEAAHPKGTAWDTAQYILRELSRLLGAVQHRQVVFVTSPAFDRKKIPAPWNESMPVDYGKHVYANLKAKGRRAKWMPGNVTLLDFYALTRACVWDNCTWDGGHRARYVNRLKAQVTLNAICPRPAAPACDVWSRGL